ncbi:hypothetical protein BGW42_004385 [Actinomortierella wolfii]|nr:hypothetical protein BGW42_004385 [Actinomortierella wolfii]
MSSKINNKATTSQTILASASGSETSLEKLGSCGHNQDQPHLLSSPRQQQQHYLASRRSASLSMSSQSILQELMRERELCRLASASSLSSMSSSGLRRDMSFLSANDADGEDEAGLSHVTSPISPTSTMPSLMAALTDREPEGTQFARGMTTTPPPLVLESMATSPVDQSNDGDDEYDGHSPSVGKGAQSRHSHSSRAAATRHRGTHYRHQGEHAFSSTSSTRSGRRSSDQDYFHEAVVTSIFTQLPRSEFILGSEDDSDYNTDDSQDLLLPKSTTEDSLSESHVEQTVGMRITTTTATTSRCVEERNGQRLRATSPDSILSNAGSTSDTSTLIDSDIHLPAMVQQQQQPLNNGSSEEQRQALVATSIITAGSVEIAAPTAVRPSLTLQTLSHSQQRHATESVGAAATSEGPLTASDSCPRSARPSLTKCNSTSSLYIDSTMTKNDVDETLRAKVLESHKQNDCRTEPIINSTSYIHTDRVMMTEADIFDFMRFIFDCGQNLGAENAIITLVYLERALDRGNLSFHAINWRRLLLGALILSIKVWEDMAVFNADVCSIFDGLHVQDVNALERFMMARMEYNMSVKRSVYAAAYFRLRDVSETHSNRIYLQLAKESLSLSSSTTPSSPVDGLNSAAGASPFPWPTMAGGVSLSRKVGATVAATVTSACATIAGGSVPIGPGYRKWTLKPLTVREADRLEARSELFSCKLMMEEQDLKDMGCCLDEYASRMRLATPEDLYHSMHTLASTIGSSSTTTNSVSGSMPSNTVSGKNTTASDSGSSLVSSSTAQTLHSSTTMSSLHSTTPSNVTASTQMPTKNGLASADASTLIASMPPRTLRMKKSRSDFFYQNTTPAAIM